MVPFTRDTPPPPKAEFDRLGFNTICEIEPDLAWVEIENSEQAEFAARAGHTPVNLYFDGEAKSNKGRPAPHRWFMLAATVGDTVKGEVVMAAPGPGLDRRRTMRHVSPLHVVAFENANPYPDWALEISGLSSVVKIPMPPNYAGNPVETKVAKVVELLDAYGKAKFGSRWLPPHDTGPDCEAVKLILWRAHVGYLSDKEDADTAVGPFVTYGDAQFGKEWHPSKADEFIGEQRADELRTLLDWVDAENEARLEDDGGHSI